MSVGIEEKSSEYADEGTAAHDVIELSLREAKWPEHFAGQMVNGFPVDRDMIAATTIFVTHVRQLLAENPGCYWQPEQQMMSRQWPDHGGTVDFHLSAPDVLHIVDYKHGRGVPVEVKNNEQLLCYALLAWSGQPRIRMTIVQPRNDHPDGPIRTWECDADYLSQFTSRVTEAMQRSNNAAAILTHNKPEDNLDLFVISDEGCRWCPVQPTCPAHYAEAVNNAELAYGDITVIGGEMISPEQIERERILHILRNADRIRAFLKAVEEHAKNEAHAGRPPEGYKLVQTEGNRRWAIKEDELLKKLRNKGFGKKDCVTTSVMSFNKLKGLEGMDAEWLDAFTERPITGVKLVPESDKRVAYQDPEADYAHVTPEE